MARYFDTYNVIRYSRGETAESLPPEIQVIISFAAQGTEDILNRRPSRDARRTCPQAIWRVAQRKLDQLNAAVSLRSLGVPPGNRLEALRGDRAGQHSIRINDQFRVCFVWTDPGPEQVEITDYH